MANMTVAQAMQLALQHQQAGHPHEAQQIYRDILKRDPRNAQALNSLGILVAEAGDNPGAIALLRKAVAASPSTAEFHVNLGEFHRRDGNLERAITSLTRATGIRPDFPEAHYNLARALQADGQLDAAIAQYQKAIDLRPDFAEAHCNLAVLLRDQGHLDAALAAVDHACKCNARYPAAHYNRGCILADLGRLDDAFDALRHSIELQPAYAHAWSNLGTALKDLGRVEEAVDAYDHALALQPDQQVFSSNRLCTLLYHPNYDAPAILEQHRLWGRRLADSLRQEIKPLNNDPSPARRLRIGYVSPDFRDHAVGRNILPLFREHDHANFEIFCYSNSGRSDAFTEQFQKHADAWRQVLATGDHDLAEQIRRDRIDILVDLSLHTAGNRLPVFARKPAPVQVCFAGYPGGTGLETIDYRLTDPHLDPPGSSDNDYLEKSIRLPHSFWCYDPAAMMAGIDNPPGVAPLPAATNGFITFGCLNNFCKVNETTLQLWMKILHAVDNSKLILMAPDGSPRRRIGQLLEKSAIAPDRIEFVGRRSRGAYLELYHRIDIGLDTLPYNGHTTSLDSFWMGVPVLTLAGRTVVGRAGLGQLHNLGLPELAAQSPDDYVRLVADLARDLPRLAALRAELRRRMEQSPLANATLFARNIETVYRQLWQTWCAAR